MEGKLNLPINVLSKHIIDCQLRELKGSSLPAGQKSPYLCLQLLCSMVPSTQLSHITLQFVRYSTLLYNVKRLKDGELNEHILKNILAILITITEAPELRMEFLQSSLGSLLMDTNAGLNKGGVEKYWKKLVSFVEAVLQYYSLSPDMQKCLTSDAFLPTPKGRRTRRNPGKDYTMSPTKQQKLVSDLVPYVVVVNANSDGSYPNDLTEIADVEAQARATTPPPLLPLVNLPPLLNVSSQEEYFMNLPNVRHVIIKTENVPDDQQLAVAVSGGADGNSTTTQSGNVTTSFTEGECSGMASSVGSEHVQSHKGIFANAKPSNSEMEWTSDESDCIGTSENLEDLLKPVYSIETPKPSPATPRACRRKWTEEEHACLLAGVKILGEGKWKEIKNMFHEVLKDRECVHLKDRYRNTEGKRGKKREQKQLDMT